MTRRFALAAAIVCCSSALAAAPPARQTALDRYVAKPDPTYKYELVNTFQAGDNTVYVIDLTSQTWRRPEEVDKTVWKHWLTIVKPKQVKSDTGMMMISGGSTATKAPTDINPLLRALADGTGTVVSELRMIPNQPLTFAGESKGRTEDAMIAYTWDKFLKGGDEEWPARLPMVKSAVRAMDTITAFMGSDKGGGVRVDKFVLAGASKRGWTTWDTAAVDSRRVVGIIPIVIDVLNVQKSMDHHYQGFGFWSPAIGDYIQMGMQDWFGTKRYQELMDIEDPITYKDRLTMPKFIVNGTGDQYWQVDSWRFYYPELKGEKYLRYVPNADHGVDRGSDAIESIYSWYAEFVAGRPMPKFDWSIQKDGSIRVTAKDQPSSVKLWQAENTDGRDFRLVKIGKAWTASDLKPVKPGVWEARVDAPAKGYKAFMVELTFDRPNGKPLKLTTGVKVAPDKMPFPAFRPAARALAAAN